MAQIKTSAGKFELEVWTDGHPHWVKIRVEGHEVLVHLGAGHCGTNMNIVPDDLNDLIYACQRMMGMLGTPRT